MKCLKKVAWCALGAVAVGAVACAVVHRRVIVSMVTGKPMPEVPEWHKKWHPLAKDGK